MKITFVTSTLHSGGSERVMSLLANNLSDRGYEVEILCINKHIIFYPLRDKVKVWFAEDEVGTSIFKKAIWLRKHVKATNPDMVIAFMLEVFCLTLAALIGIKIPVISSERIDPHFFGKAKGFLRWLLLRRTTHLVVQTQQIKAFYSKKLQARTTIIPNPVTEKVFELKPVEKENRLIAVGRLAYQKNYSMMLEAMKNIISDFPDYHLVIYGDGPERKVYEQEIADKGLEKYVSLPGKTERILEEMNRSKVFVMTSDFEGMSNAMLEAICVGLPVVTTEVSGAHDLIENGKNGFITKVRDVNAFTDALRKVLSDEELMKTMGELNRQKAENFKTEKIVDQWEALILQIAK